MSKEKVQVGISEETLERHRKVMEELDCREEERKRETPEAPDKSGEIGRYDEDASNWFGGAFVYKTDSGKYFTWNGFVNPLHLESYLMYQDREKPKE